MNAILPDDAEQATLYQALARIPARLVLVSSAYDDLLEQAFTFVGKPFARLSAIIRPLRHLFLPRLRLVNMKSVMSSTITMSGNSTVLVKTRMN